jgi:tagaturonate reductase
LNTIVVDDLTPYRTRKVRILNGAHTAMTPVAYLSHLETVEDVVNDPDVGVFLTEMITEEIIPTLEGEEKELSLYAEEVLSRFANPYFKHYLMSISLNSISKFQTRNIPTFLEYMNHKCMMPKRMVFSLSSLIYFYRGKRGEENIDLQDQLETLKFFREIWKRYEEKMVTLHQLTEEVLSNDQLWGRNLADIPNLVEMVANHLLQIEENGVPNALKELNEKVCK